MTYEFEDQLERDQEGEELIKSMKARDAAVSVLEYLLGSFPKFEDSYYDDITKDEQVKVEDQIWQIIRDRI